LTLLALFFARSLMGSIAPCPVTPFAMYIFCLSICRSFRMDVQTSTIMLLLKVVWVVLCENQIGQKDLIMSSSPCRSTASVHNSQIPRPFKSFTNLQYSTVQYCTVQ
jgi:hypothetical protein